MSTTLDAVFSSWPAQPGLAMALAAIAVVYVRGWIVLHRRDRHLWNGSRLAPFLGGLVLIYLALASPIEAFAPLLLQVHMLQHLLLMMIVPPLVWLGAPLFPMLRGLPSEVRRYWVVPIMRSRSLRGLARAVTHPLGAWIIFVACAWLWHLPATYQAALANDGIHKLQHFCFLGAGLTFWYPVMRPFPARPAWSLWWLVPYLLLADNQNTLLSAWLTFSDQVIYAHYAAMPRLGGLSAIDDQAAAGVLMWVPGSVAFLLPLAWIGVKLVQNRKVEGGRQKAVIRNQGSGVRGQGARSPAQPLTAISALRATPHSPFPIPHFDLLRLPLIGPVLRSSWTRRAIQFAMLIIVVAVIIDGFGGPQIGPMNLAGVVPWIHWRWLVVVGLLAAGNVFCYGCPFMLPRAIARRWLASSVRRSWPKALRTKWLAVGLLALFLWSYEAFSLWNRPWLTAWILIAYFAGALVVDSVFRDAAFCKFVCPIGQFHFVQSIVSPLEVRVREPAACNSCRSHDCIQGRTGAGHETLAGCELQLFLPRKAGNLDCTFCLDCVRACPHDNVGVLATTPTVMLWRDGSRSGIGRLSHRLDYAAMAMVLTFGAFANAAGMTRPAVDLQSSIQNAFALSSTFVITTAYYILSLLVVPLAAVFAAALSTRAHERTQRSVREIACRFGWSLVPLGFAMWLAHYSFHFFTGFDTIIPVTQQFVAGFGFNRLGPPNWVCSCCRPAPDWLLDLEILMLDIGLLASLYTAWRIAWSQRGNEVTQRWRAVRLAAPWAIVAIALFAIGIWILLQPMDMRGTLTGG